MIVNLVLLLFMILIIIISSTKIKLLYKQLLNYEEIIKGECIKNHEYKNQLIVLSGFLDNKEYKKATDYLDMISSEFKNSNYYEVKELLKITKSGMKKLIYYKTSKMNQLKINYSISISDNSVSMLEKINIKTYYDLTKIMGVLLDNAIDASKYSSKKEVELLIEKKDNYLIINIINSVEKDLNIKKIGKLGYTTKGICHGYGLQIVKGILKRNKSIEVVHDFVENKYNQTILVDI